jgi:Cysteine-rich secretory protein family
MGTRTFKDTFATWKSSSGHNANLLKPNATRIGLASASAYGTTYWALILAAEPNRRRPNQSTAAVNVLSVFPFVVLIRGGAP